jgi:hypothetical protein
MRSWIATLGTALLLGGCVPTGGTQQHWGPEKPSRKPVASTSGSAEVEPDEPPVDGSESAKVRRAERLAARLLDGNAAWLPEKRAFLVITAFSEDATGTGTTGEFLVERPDPNAGNEEGESPLCEPGAACDGDPDDLLRAATDWLLDMNADNAIVVEPLPFASDKGAPSTEVGAIGGRVLWSRDHIDIVRPKKAAASLAKIVVEKEWTLKPVAVVPSPDGQLLLVLFDMDPGAKFSQGFNAFVETRVYKVP